MPESNEIGVGDLLKALGQECATLAAISERVQTIIVCAGGSSAADRSFYHDAQACDLLTQSLSAISGFLAAISQRMPPRWTLDIADVLQELPLSDLAAALASKPKSNVKGASGTIDFF